jgi:DNA modification methylase
MTWHVHHGNSLEVLKTLESESLDSVVCDPPYGLSEHSPEDILEALTCWMRGDPYTHSKKGFMGTTWDSFVPGPEIWRECFRVLKPGGHLLAFAGTRTMDLMGLAIRISGFESRDAIMVNGLLQWTQSQGFPKSHDAAKALDKELGVEREVVGYQWGVGGENLNDIVKGSDDVRSTEDDGGKGLGAYGVGAKQVRVQIPITKSTSEEAKKWEGWGTALKPAWEPVLMFRKPFSEKNLAKNLLTHGVGAINVDGCRVPTNVPVKIMSFDDGMKAFGGAAGHPYTTTESDKGRWPPNWVVCHHPECVPIGSTVVQNGLVPKDPEKHWQPNKNAYGARTSIVGKPHGDENGKETIETYECHPDCHVRALNAQSEPTTSGKATSLKGTYEGESQTKFLRGSTTPDNQHGDSGHISRFFPNFKYEDLDVPFCYTPKVAKSERDAGLIGDEKVSDPYAQHRGRRMETPERFDGKPVKMGRNTHPTVKPQALLSWLIKMVTPPGGTVLDPFTGSGSTGCAAVRGGFNFIGVELQEEYVDIARQRISYWESAEKVPTKSRKAIPQSKETQPSSPSVLDMFG